MQSNRLSPPYIELNPIILSFKCLRISLHHHNFLKDVNCLKISCCIFLSLTKKVQHSVFILSGILPDCYTTAKECLHNASNGLKGIPQSSRWHSQTPPPSLKSKFTVLSKYLIVPGVKTQQNVNFNTTNCTFIILFTTQLYLSKVMPSPFSSTFPQSLKIFLNSSQFLSIANFTTYLLWCLGLILSSLPSLYSWNQHKAQLIILPQRHTTTVRIIISFHKNKLYLET